MTPYHQAKIALISMSLLFLFLLVACSSPPPPGNIENGQKWYKMHNCNSCHGENGKGGRGPSVAGIEMSFGSFVKKLRKADAAIMPPFPESKLSEQDAADIYALLKSTK